MRLVYRPNESPRLRYETNPHTSVAPRHQKVKTRTEIMPDTSRVKDEGAETPLKEETHYSDQLPQERQYPLPWGAFLYLPEPTPAYLARLVRHGRLRAAQAIRAILEVAADQVIQETMEGLEVLASQVAEEALKEEEDHKGQEAHRDRVDHQVARSLLNCHKPKQRHKEKGKSGIPLYLRGTGSKLRHSLTPSSYCSLEDQMISPTMQSKSQVPSPTWRA